MASFCLSRLNISLNFVSYFNFLCTLLIKKLITSKVMSFMINYYCNEFGFLFFPTIPKNVSCFCSHFFLYQKKTVEQHSAAPSLLCLQFQLSESLLAVESSPPLPTHHFCHILYFYFYTTLTANVAKLI